MADVTCGKGCCEWYDQADENWYLFGGDWGGGEGEPPVYCYRTGERLSTKNGQPVVEPRPSPEYVALLEAAVRNGDAVAAMLPSPCYRAVRDWGWARCEHGGILECLRALAEAHDQRVDCALCEENRAEEIGREYRP